MLLRCIHLYCDSVSMPWQIRAKVVRASRPADGVFGIFNGDFRGNVISTYKNQRQISWPVKDSSAQLMGEGEGVVPKPIRFFISNKCLTLACIL